MEAYTYQTLLVEVEQHIAHVKMNNPQKANAMTQTFWKEIREVMQKLDHEPEVRVVVLSGEGKHFSSGIDLSMFGSMQADRQGKDEGRFREHFRRHVLELQSSFTAIEKCAKPVIAAIHGACVGGAIDMISACDMRYCSEDAYFCVKEIDLGIVADVGTLQRLPKIIADGVARELAFTARRMSAQEAEQVHLVNRCYPNQEEMMEAVQQIAASIAAKSPLATRGTKEILNYTRDHSVEDGLNYVATWNAAMIFSNDVMEAMQASMQKRDPEFSN